MRTQKNKALQGALFLLIAVLSFWLGHEYRDHKSIILVKKKGSPAGYTVVEAGVGVTHDGDTIVVKRLFDQIPYKSKGDSLRRSKW